MTAPPTVTVVGAGVSGLACAARLLDERPELRVSVLDGAPRAGGLIGTIHKDGCLIELGPDSILTEKPAALELAKSLGLEAHIISTQSRNRGAYVVRGGRLHRIPEGFTMMAPSNFLPVLASPILSWRGKARMIGETLLPRRGGGGDESVGHFVRRRFGEEVLTRLAQPLMGGIYGTDVDMLSLHSTMPRFSMLEAEHRSVTLGLLQKSRGTQVGEVSGVRYGLFVSFDGGVQTLTDALARRLGSRLELGESVHRIEKSAAGYTLHLEGETRQTDALVLATPARPMARMLRSMDVALSESLLDIPYGSSAAVYYCFARKDVPHPLDAFGFVVPKAERRRVLASTWANVKFAGRAPADTALLRVFFGGDGSEEMLELDDEGLVRVGRSELTSLLGIRAEPRFAHVSRHPHAMPKYLVGHSGRVTRIERHVKRHPKLELAGNSMYGVGIPDAVRSGQAAAERLVSALDKEQHGTDERVAAEGLTH